MKPPKGVPRDEWLLAIGLATVGKVESASQLTDRMQIESTEDWTAVFEGAYDEKNAKASAISVNGSTRNRPRLYAVGAALWEALNS